MKSKRTRLIWSPRFAQEDRDGGLRNLPHMLPKLHQARKAVGEIADLFRPARVGTLEHIVGLKADSFIVEADYLLQRECLPFLPKVRQRRQPKLGVIDRSAFDQADYGILAGFGSRLWLVKVAASGQSASFGIRASTASRAYQAGLAFYRCRYLNTKTDPRRNNRSAWVESIHLVLNP